MAVFDKRHKVQQERGDVFCVHLAGVIRHRRRQVRRPQNGDAVFPTNFAPTLWTCSFTAGRTSYASTTAPRRRAVEIAWSPATPTPTMNTCAGVIVPAAVVRSGNMRGSASAASSTAL